MWQPKKMKLNKKEIEDKILACWIGKNIGGTIGAPYEGKTDMQDVKGYTTPKGEPLPNDDLDLQLVWLYALEKVGPFSLSTNALSEYWLAMIGPYWNEYGVGKANIANGLLPPLSGEYTNDKWKHSNGAWIRSEIWACLAPGLPNIAIKYAMMDAMVDHGMGEGFYAEIFTAALESIAFTQKDIRKIIETSLTYIPQKSRVYECVKCVINEYDKKTPYEKVRNMLVEMTSDLGWFQAPQNVGYVVIGLMYGEGDFKKSMIYAVNCGDDTDCTGGTVGAILGIVGGTKNIPSDWKEYIGDKIVTVSINGAYLTPIPKTCTALTQRVMNMIPCILKAQEINVEFTDGESEYNEEVLKTNERYIKNILDQSAYSFNISNGTEFSAAIEFEKEPVVKSDEEIKVKIKFFNYFREPFNADIKAYLPDTWSAVYDKNIFVKGSATVHWTEWDDVKGECNLVITPGEIINSKNDIIISVTSPARAMPLLIPITILG
ncbi:MAG: ADP-ribosylglycohydrolase family protein [Ruminococcaceae bacterium]|nr:ADP-ribosylglycohydrolase family protein [Oscillospiraceae bacterium]